MIHHLTIRVRDLDRARRFYTAALAPLGYRVLAQYETFLGMGAEGGPDLWLGQYQELTPMHVAFAAPDHGSIEDFHRSAIAAGGIDNGPPGPRPQYSPKYYGAFVLDPDGNNIEATLMVTPRRAGEPATQGKAKKPGKKAKPAKKAKLGKPAKKAKHARESKAGAKASMRGKMAKAARPAAKKSSKKR